jgi:alpha-galactosidase
VTARTWSWGDGPARLCFEVRADETVRASWLSERADSAAGHSGSAPLDVLTAESGRRRSGYRYVESSLGGRMKYRGHQVSADGDWLQNLLSLEDRQTGLRTEVVFRACLGLGVVRSFSRPDGTAL